MEVSKFKIGNNIIDVKDAQARDDVIAAMNAAQDAQSTADLKQDANTAWKCAQLTNTFNNITIANNGIYNFTFDKPSGVTNVVPIYARSSNGDRPLIPINMFASDNIYCRMYNAGSAISNTTIVIQITYMYQ